MSGCLPHATAMDTFEVACQEFDAVSCRPAASEAWERAVEQYFTDEGGLTQGKAQCRGPVALGLHEQGSPAHIS